MLYLHHGNMEIKKQTQVVSHHKYRKTTGIKADIRRHKTALLLRKRKNLSAEQTVIISATGNERENMQVVQSSKVNCQSKKR